MTATVQQKEKENKKETREKNGYYFSKEKKKTRSHFCVCHTFTSTAESRRKQT